MTKILFNRVAFIGMGLIGSSIARVMRRDNLANTIIACARTDKTLEAVVRLNLADETTKDIASAALDADLVMICTPLSTYSSIAQALGPVLKAGSIVSDVGSVKVSAINAIKPHLPEGVHFVPGHPIAGTENSGPDAGFESLFEDRWLLLTPPDGTDRKAIDQISTLWEAAGSKVNCIDPEHHDQVLAITSHLPHLIAFTIVGTATDLEDDIKSEVIKYSASGFRDFTRIAASDPVMWRDIFISNREAVLEMLGRLSEDLSSLQRAIRVGDGDKLESLFRRTREIRRGVVEAGQHIPPNPEKN